MPERIQRKRSKGWRMPEGAIYVGRPTKCTDDDNCCGTCGGCLCDGAC
ncbi:hypothetical protein SEA_JUNG_59 [Mycobacterium phage Jung]|uniref:Uncharacterized protein n=1 Tax=Mycobacterium phage Jung TaxID=2742107 RepID=A0AAE7K6B4_9CAUD|nr:hypothetical protein I5J41_gp59 [Mycobacterium phage Jung]QKY80234.1 hypothetical protein SEA_JUNG_59 [Mycobacterium phage Jung]